MQPDTYPHTVNRLSVAHCTTIEFGVPSVPRCKYYPLVQCNGAHFQQLGVPLPVQVNSAHTLEWCGEHMLRRPLSHAEPQASSTCKVSPVLLAHRG